jgi:hypothetical protein
LSGIAKGPIVGKVTNGVPEVVSTYAPLVRLHSNEEYWPMDAGEFVHSCSLGWATSDGVKTVYVAGQTPKRPRLRVNLRRLAAKDESAYLSRRSSFRACDHTRPYDRVDRPTGLAEREGFCLSLAARDGRKGTPSTSADPRVYVGAPAYYEYEPEKARITYWFFYAGSTAPLRLVPLHESLALAMAPGEEPPQLDVDPIAAVEAAKRAYPRAIEERGQVALTVELSFDPIGAAWRAVRRLYDLLRQAPEFPFMHEGDWERITVYLSSNGKAVGAAYHQHQGAEPLRWNKLEREDGHPVVYSAQGSHASLPRTKDALDRADDKGRSWRTWDNLVDVHQAWFGFGGAWGKPGPIADATGPLGPSEWKRAWQPGPGAF